MRKLFSVRIDTTSIILYLFTFLIFTACNEFKNDSEGIIDDFISVTDSITEVVETVKILSASDINLTKEIQFEKYILDDQYEYEDTIRYFQWNKIKEKIAHIENEININSDSKKFVVFSNYKNMNGEAPTVPDFVRNEYRRVSDHYGIERYQSVPLYSIQGDTVLVRYGRDGWIAKIIDNDTTEMIRVKGVSFDGEYLIPNRYLINWGDSIKINQVIAVDVTNQNISVIEKRNNTWNILSMNPATTGVHKPPYASETPIGIFAIQDQKEKMFYTKDGSNEIAGYAPYASRFTNGAYIHGVPTQLPQTRIIEWSNTLGTTPRSHMCVRVASSQAKFVFDLITVKEAVVVVID